jgi:predicted negative regulator of RcsB-dependent stress response
MEIYDQHEQSERVRSWLKDNGGAIVTGIVIGLGVIFGYHQWQNYKVRQAHEAAMLYDRTRADQIAATPADPADTATGAADPAIDAARGQLRSDYPKSGFAVLAALEQAAAQAKSGDFDGARIALTWARDNSREEEVHGLVLIRLAQVELAAGKPDAALKALETGIGASYAGQRDELRGDAYAALGQHDQAKSAYEAALTANPGDTARLEMKLSEYASATPAANGKEGA